MTSTRTFLTCIIKSAPLRISRVHNTLVHRSAEGRDIPSGKPWDIHRSREGLRRCDRQHSSHHSGRLPISSAARPAEEKAMMTPSMTEHLEIDRVEHFYREGFTKHFRRLYCLHVASASSITEMDNPRPTSYNQPLQQVKEYKKLVNDSDTAPEETHKHLKVNN